MSGCMACQNCELCQGCNSGCNTCQSFCENGHQTVGSFSFNECVSQGQILLHKTNWDRLITYIRNAYRKGSLCNASEYRISDDLPQSDPNNVITADIFNKIAAALKNLTPAYNRLSVNVGDVIYGSYFETLEDYANRLKYRWEQCNVCNASCDAMCNGSCNLCNAGSEAVHCCSTACQHSCQDAPAE